jgi:RNA polymerase sigma-70 factor (ECF subfamily)
VERIERLVRLAAATRNGHPELLGDLLAESAGIVHAVARARLGETLAAEEAAADALVRAASGLAGLRDPGAYPRWLARIAARCTADAAKRRTAGDERPEDAPGGGPDPAAAARAAERSRAVRVAVSHLPPRLREPVLLHFSEGLTYREVSRTLGTGLGTVARRMRKALRLLKQTLGEEP